jgi:chromosome segregation ATPase
MRIPVYIADMKRFMAVLWLGTLVGLLYGGGTRQQPEVAAMRSDLDGLKSDINRLKSEQSTTDARIASLTNSVEDVKRQRDELKSQVDELRSKADNTLQRSDLDSVRNDLQGLRADFDNAAGNLGRAFKKELGGLRKSATDNERDLAKLDSDFSQLQKSSELLRGSIDGLEKKLDLHSARLEQVRKQTHIKAWIP